eukprot:gene2264-2479_t
MASFESKPVEKFDVVVVGAGVSGLKAAKELISKHGVEASRVLVLDAQDYVGGRIKQSTDFIPGVKVELGAEIVHGNGTFITDFAREQGEALQEIYCWAHGDGGPMERPVNGGYGLYFVGDGWSEEKTSSRLIRFDDEDPEFVRLNESLWDLEKVNLDTLDASLSLKDHLLGLGFKESMLRMADAGFANTFCSRMEELSIKEAARWIQRWNDSEEGEFKLVNSYGVLIRFLQSGVSNIRLKKVVNRVVREEGKVIVETEDGDVFHSKAVILAIPPPVLASGKISFTPPLPERKVTACRSTQMNRACKVFVKFSKIFWPAGLTGTITADPNALIPEIWFRDVRDLIEDDSQGVGYATGFVTSSFADHICSIPEEEVFKAMVSQLDKMFSHLKPRDCFADIEKVEETLLSSDVVADLPKPSEVYLGGIIQKWTPEVHPFIHGGYCSPLKGFTHAGETVAESVDDQLFFVGEGANIGHGGVIHAAMESAVRAAKEVKAVLDKN